MTKTLKTITCIALVGIALLAVTGFPEEVLVKQNVWDRTAYWNYVSDAKDGSRVFFNDARVQSFWFKKGTKESTFRVNNPVFIVGGDLMASYRYAIVGHKLFATYRIIDMITGEKVSKSYVYCITGLDQASTPEIESLGIFYREKAWFNQVVRLDRYFVALVTDFVKGKTMIEVYDEYKRLVAEYPVIETTGSLYYSQSKNSLCFVEPNGALTLLDMDTLYPTTFAFQETPPEFNKPSLPLLSIFAKDEAANHIYYGIPGNGTSAAALLMEADLSSKKVRLVSILDGQRILSLYPFNQRYVVTTLVNKQDGTRCHLYDTIDNKYIPLKASFHALPFFCITLERPRSTPHLFEKAGDEYIFKFFDDFAFDDASIDLIRK